MFKSPFNHESPLLTKTAEYALRALLVLARHGNGQPLSAVKIARMTAAPSNYLSKTLLTLARTGLIRSTPGRSGGFELLERPDQITVAQIADLFAEPRWSRHCLLGTGVCDSSTPCAAHWRWHAVIRAARAPLLDTTLASLLGDDALSMLGTQNTETSTSQNPALVT
ncbi:MAG: Rrf2 family transcriptional regulator [Gemmatimonadota bacterium]